MKTRSRAASWCNVLGTVLAFAGASLALSPAYASDTEVYARRVDFSGTVTPVLMMVLDSSGSMNWCMSGAATCPQSDRKITALRNGMRTMLFGNPYSTSAITKPAPGNVKMGYARFNPNANDGGWMRYPALALDSVVPDSLTESGSVGVPIVDGPSDAVGSTLNGTSYSLGNGEPDVGLRFADVQVPKNATITGAQLYFSRDGTGTGVPASLRLSVEDTDNALAYSAASTTTTRAYGAAVDTNVDASDTYLNVTALIQAQVNRPGWCGGQAIGIKVAQGTGSKYMGVYSAEGGPSATTSLDARPRLLVSYTISGAARTSSCMSYPVHTVAAVNKSGLDDIEWPEGGTLVEHRSPLLHPGAIPDGVRNQVGVRFTQLPLAQGASIEQAWLYMTASNSTASAAATVDIHAFAKDNAPAFCTQDATTKVVSCPTPDDAGATGPGVLALPASTLEGVHYVADVKNLVQAVVNRPGWVPDNALAFRARNSAATNPSSNTAIFSAESGLSKAMVLHVIARKQYTNLNDINKTARQDLFDDINVRMFASGGTPLGDAYAEAARYMMGMSPYSMNTFTTTFDEQAPSQTYKQPDPRTATSTATSTVYNSPLPAAGTQCSANYLFMMSDGVPNNVSNVVNNNNGVTATYNPDCSAYNKYPVSLGTAATNFACMMSVATHLSSGKNQKSTVTRTNTVLFDAELTGDVVDDMRKVAEFGKGQFFHAKNQSQLTDSLLNTLTSLLDETGSITAPGVAVNQFNRLTHLDQLYYAVFDPDALHSRWRGNVKRYRLAFSTTGASIVDKNSNPAIDPTSTFFSTNAHSFWSPVKDGNNALLGGVSSVLPVPTARKIYTFLGNNPATPTSSTTALSELTGTSPVTPTAAQLTAMGLTSTQFTNLRNWLTGYRIDIVEPATTSPAAPAKIKTTAVPVSTSTLLRNELGGVLHSQPVLVNYGYSGSDPTAAQTDPSLQDNTVFFSTMEGMLHAANANTGAEVFAFMPQETLARADEVVINGEQPDPEFGLDLTWVIRREDGNKDLKINSSSDKLYLYGGMRMGGRNYYAIDATDRSSPKLKWVLQGGSGSFADIGQTWSKPALGQVKVNNVIKTILIFAGGYDNKHETAGFDTTVNASDAKGKQLYIVDADTGGLMWWASSTGTPTLIVPDMKFSIPSEPKLFDANKDGLIDAVYFGDMGGQVFRLDINNATTTNSGLGDQVVRLANVGQLVTANTANQRRFYEAPSVATLLDNNTKLPYVVVAMGSGYRSHPLDLQTNDAFYVFRDNDVLRADVLTASDLQPTITPTDLAVVDLSTTAGANLTGKKGWVLNLPVAGEKVLASPIILFGEVFFSTYIPDLSSAETCTPVIGKSNLWRMSVTDAAVINDFNNDGVVTTADRSVTGVVRGLGGAPQLLVGEDGRNAIITGTGVIRNNDLANPSMRRTRWYEKEAK